MNIPFENIFKPEPEHYMLIKKHSKGNQKTEKLPNKQKTS